MSEIREKIKDFSDEFLLEQYYNNRHEYTPDAVAFMQEEISARKLNNKDKKTPDKNANGNSLSGDTVTEYMQEDFVPFDHGFYQTDLLLAQAILREEKIPFYVDSNVSSDTLPLANEANRYFTINIPKSLLEKVRETIDKHFDKSDGLFSVKYSNVKERLKSFCFYEIQLTGSEMEQEIDIHFTAQESYDIQKYIDKLINEADTLEQESGKVLFYFDNLKECAKRITEKKRSTFSQTDLLTILEVLQVYCNSEDFPALLDNTAEALLNFFGT